MAQGKKVEFTITDGPPKDALIAALFFNSETTPHRVSFTLVPYGDSAKEYGSAPRVFETVVNGIERESGCGTSWILKGLVSGVGQDFSCYYDSRGRKGHFTTWKKA